MMTIVEQGPTYTITLQLHDNYDCMLNTSKQGTAWSFRAANFEPTTQFPEKQNSSISLRDVYCVSCCYSRNSAALHDAQYNEV